MEKRVGNLLVHESLPADVSKFFTLTSENGKDKARQNKGLICRPQSSAGHGRQKRQSLAQCSGPSWLSALREEGLLPQDGVCWGNPTSLGHFLMSLASDCALLWGPRSLTSLLLRKFLQQTDLLNSVCHGVHQMYRSTALKYGGNSHDTSGWETLPSQNSSGPPG